MSVVVRTAALGKRYGDRWALQGVDLSIAKGEIVGFIGPNGAGKTTLIALLSGLARPSAGTAILAPAARVAIVSERCGFIPHLSGRKNLELLAAIQKREPPGGVAGCLSAVKLDPDDGRPTKSYSLGMQQRLMIAQALLAEPDLLLLDEPTNGLDPEGIVLLRKLLTDLAGRGAAILLASHLLTEVEKLCHRAILVNHGKVMREIVLETATSPEIRVVFSSKRDHEKFDRCGAYPYVDVEGRRHELPEIRIRAGTDVMTVVARLLAEGISIEEIGRQRTSLEDAFLELLQ